ncbi:MAG: hypothetical protein MUP52_09530 [Candidatus Aminicenantes bacterium]|nr:hypothetical protein [Candidatus Aminicenantes bacterium]
MISRQSTEARLANTTLGIRVDRPASLVTTGLSLFSVVGGNVLVNLILGEVTVVMQTTASAGTLRHHPTTGTILDLAAAVEWSDLHVGTLLTIDSVRATNIQLVTGLTLLRGQSAPVILTPGHVELAMAAPMTGQQKYSIWYKPLDELAYISTPSVDNLSVSSQEMLTNMQLGIRVDRPTAVATATVPIYTVTGGRVAINLLLGEVTTALDAGANLCTLAAHPTVGALTNLATTVDWDAMAIGTLISVSGVVGDALQVGTGAVRGQDVPWVMGVGHIEPVMAAAAAAGRIKWSLWYTPIDTDAVVTAA